MVLGRAPSMRRKQAFWGDRALSILIAGLVGYLLGGWNPAVLRTTELSAAQMVALRFPQGSGATAVDSPATPAANATATRAAAEQSALLNPEPMIPQVAPAQPAVTRVSVTPTELPQTPMAETSVSQVPVEVATVDQAAPARDVALTP